MSAHLTEEEQLEALKRWWNENGKFVTAAVVVAVGGFWGWSQYQSHITTVTQENSLTFQKMASAVGEIEQSDDTAVKEAKEAEAIAIAEQLSNNQSDTLYGDFAQLYLAKKAIEEQDWESAKSQLNQVIQDPGNSAVKELAQLRLARVLATSGDSNAALELLNADVSNAFASLYAEAKGDLFMAKGELGKAQEAYQASMDALDEQDFMRRSTLGMKLENTSVASDDPEIQPSNPHGNVPHNPHNATAQAGDA